ncbi:hypothetical protein [Streptomyces sp. NRRL S-31]|uniref:hypothetical protein n=1 Tax=Streptomyces sp. NRRL S-31 TaxID=1463898 RepID=UPI0004C5360E
MTRAHHGGLAAAALPARTPERSSSRSVCFMCSARISSRSTPPAARAAVRRLPVGRTYSWSVWWVMRYLRADAITRQSIRQAVRVRRTWDLVCEPAGV